MSGCSQLLTAVDINALENDKEYKQAFKSLFRKIVDLEGS